ncbi:UNVERIFIED_CONTAM: hypothetical protein K2H54_068233 [Gekko kuhli]
MAKDTEDFPLEILLLGPYGAGKSTVAVQVLYRWGGLGPRMTQAQQKQMEQRSLTYDQVLAFLHGARGSSLPCQYESPKYVLSLTSTASCFHFPCKSQAAYVLLVVSAARRDFEASWKLLQQQISLACKLCVQQLVVCVNKMDATDPPYYGRRYKSIVRKVSVHLRGLRRNPRDVAFLPISAVSGDNMQDASQEMPWFRGWEIREEAGGTLRGMTLRQLLDGVLLSHKMDSCSAIRDWSLQEEKSLLLAWRAMASPASRTPPCPHVLSAALLRAGVRRTPEQCRSKANLLLNGYIAARLQGRQSIGAFCDISEELQAVLDHEATQCLLQMGRMELMERACGEEEEPATPGPPLLPELLLAGEVLGAQKGPGVCSQGPPRSPGGRGGDPPARPPCLSLPSGQRDRDPDCLITGLEIQPCGKTAWQTGSRTEPGAEEEEAFSEGYRCVVHRRAYFAVKQKPPEMAVRPQPRLDVPTSLLGAPPLHPPVAQRPLLPPIPEESQLVLYPWPPAPPAPAQWGAPPPLSLPSPPLQLPSPALLLPLSPAEPLLQVDSSGLAFPTAHPVPALLPLPVPQASLCGGPCGSADAWQYQQAHVYVPLEPVGHWPSSCDSASLGGNDSSPAAAAAAILVPQEAPKPWESEEGPPDPPSAAEGSEPPSLGTPTSPLLPEAPRGSGLGLSATTLLSSLAQLDPREDPGEALLPLPPARSADAGTPSSSQLQGLLGSSSTLLSSPWPRLGPSDS